ncbi:5-dehydro-4-deoxy-D-glucuronate isomerase [Dinghuibacter silviterrae]|uniref:4-deoxy-L-threo-5-hexosulose-uronate ketol-isomerase n=1 Tax=Dinghuibacter silviterrae TaxID=1539049 RepID=A0A4R8DFQ6_9BACT|nr:5-dehydro-4-deoxy-D-glucuronate isomerase [Dinghuibacter silviterrae]TDW96443.1 4-deoxy-L-threo-5-hexulose uronate isomerase [Dinghuibacter silviterrae]
MQIRFQNSPKETAGMGTRDLRDNFLIEDLMKPGQLTWVYSHYDRVIVGGTIPGKTPVALDNPSELKADFFLQRREIGIINVGGKGSVHADGTRFEADRMDCVYLGKGTKEVSFASDDPTQPAVFYLLSSPAHQTYPNTRYTKEQASPVETGDALTSNKRVIYKYIHDKGISSSQLVMGLTILQPGSVWNTMPAHTHTRRMEAYFYFDIPEGHRVFHFMGEPAETRHLLVANHQAVLSPPWSIHSGAGTANYAFIWGMAGENYTYTDMDAVPIAGLK